MTCLLNKEDTLPLQLHFTRHNISHILDQHVYQRITHRHFHSLSLKDTSVQIRPRQVRGLRANVATGQLPALFSLSNNIESPIHILPHHNMLASLTFLRHHLQITCSFEPILQCLACNMRRYVCLSPTSTTYNSTQTSGCSCTIYHTTCRTPICAYISSTCIAPTCNSPNHANPSCAVP